MGKLFLNKETLKHLNDFHVSKVAGGETLDVTNDMICGSSIATDYIGTKTTDLITTIFTVNLCPPPPSIGCGGGSGRAHVCC